MRVDTPVLVEAREGWRKITLNRPDKLNSFTIDLHRQLAAALDKAAADEGCRAILLTGAGRGFCAGQDLNDRNVAPGEQVDLPTTAVFDPGNAVISFQPVEGALIESFTEGIHEVRVIYWRIEDGPEQALSYRWEFNVI